MAVRAITWNTLIHCVHGNDRTGLLVALWRLSQGWSKADAQAEMWANGFSGEPGLLAYWLEQRVEDWRR
jgi:protein tyrosine/serine phosphatase